MASVYGIVRSIAKAGSPVPMLRSIVTRKPIAAATPANPPLSQPAGFVALVEREIIPRLMVAHTLDEGAEPHVIAPVVGSATIDYYEAVAFAPLALNLGPAELLDRIDLFVMRGVSIDAIFVELLAPAARHLGEMWEEDTADFVEVTMALWRLQEVVRELSARVPVHGDGGAARSALFAVMPGDDHSFGTVIVEDVFRRDGWSTDLMTQTNTSTLLAKAAARSYDVIGLTVSGEECADDAAALINAVRSVSRNPRVKVMVGGRVFTVAPQLAGDIGADATAPDALQALAVARALVDDVAARHDICAR